MRKFLLLVLLSCVFANRSICQIASLTEGGEPTINGNPFGKISSSLKRINAKLQRETEKYLQEFAHTEEQLSRRIYSHDSIQGKALFGRSADQYADLNSRIHANPGAIAPTSGVIYQPYLDSLQCAIGFLKENPRVLSSIGQLPHLQLAGIQLQALQARIQNANEIKAYIQQRKQEIGTFISQHADLKRTLRSYSAKMDQRVYYFSQQLREYTEIWDNPDHLEKKVLAVLNRIPAFQSFVKSNSQLAGLFRIPGNYGSSTALSGLQGKDQVAQVIQQKISASGANAAAAIQANLQSAETQLESYKSKLEALGAGNGGMDMPGFKPNDQKTKTFWRRLEFGANLQTTRNNYMFPTVTDFGLSIGYKLGHGNLIGVGSSYKLGWGNGIQHISLSSQGVGLRSFLQIKIKGTFSANGGFEFNYAAPSESYQQLPQLQYWTKSGLIGVTKTISVKSRLLKKSSVSLLWDFLSYQQVPRTQPILFRIGYGF